MRMLLIFMPRKLFAITANNKSLLFEGGASLLYRKGDKVHTLTRKENKQSVLLLVYIINLTKLTICKLDTPINAFFSIVYIVSLWINIDLTLTPN